MVEVSLERILRELVTMIATDRRISASINGFGIEVVVIGPASTARRCWAITELSSIRFNPIPGFVAEVLRD